MVASRLIKSFYCFKPMSEQSSLVKSPHQQWLKWTVLTEDDLLHWSIFLPWSHRRDDISLRHGKEGTWILSVWTLLCCAEQRDSFSSHFWRINNHVFPHGINPQLIRKIRQEHHFRSTCHIIYSKSLLEWGIMTSGYMGKIVLIWVKIKAVKSRRSKVPQGWLV